jgi:hypothetical protein
MIRARAEKEKSTRNGTTKISKNTKKVSIMNLSGSRHELTKNVDAMENVTTSNPEIHWLPMRWR